MKFSISLIFLLACKHAVAVPEKDDGCCEAQRVGDYLYTLLPDHASREFPMDCQDRCAYSRNGQADSPDYCMKPGDLPTSCIETDPSECICPENYAPVCGKNSETYSNQCKASCAGQRLGCTGECPCEGCLMVDKTITKTRAKGKDNEPTATVEDCFNLCKNDSSCAYIKWNEENGHCTRFLMTYEDNIGFTSGPKDCWASIDLGCLFDFGVGAGKQLQNIKKTKADPEKTETAMGCQNLCQAEWNSCGFFEWDKSTTDCKLWTTTYNDKDKFTSGPIQCGA